MKTTMDRTDFIEAENHYLRTALRAKDADYRALVKAVTLEREREEIIRTAHLRPEYSPHEDRKGYAEARAAVDALVGLK